MVSFGIIVQINILWWPTNRSLVYYYQLVQADQKKKKKKNASEISAVNKNAKLQQLIDVGKFCHVFVWCNFVDALNKMGVSRHT